MGIKFKRKEIDQTPLPGAPGAPPPSHDPILNTKDHEIGDNRSDVSPEEDLKPAKFTHENNKEVLDIKKVQRLRTVKPR